MLTYNYSFIGVNFGITASHAYSGTITLESGMTKAQKQAAILKKIDPNESIVKVFYLRLVLVA
jgi:hypothetical protein